MLKMRCIYEFVVYCLGLYFVGLGRRMFRDIKLKFVWCGVLVYFVCMSNVVFLEKDVWCCYLCENVLVNFIFLI